LKDIMGSQKNNLAASSLVEKPHRGKTRLLSVAAPAGRQPDPVDGRFSISAKRRRATAQEHRKMLRRFERLKKYHPSAKAAQIIGASLTTLWRWKKAFTARGLAGLMPKTARCGRHSPFANLRLTKETLRALEMCHVEHPHSPSAAWQRFASSLLCPPLVARAVRRKGSAPAPLAGIGRVSLVRARVFASADQRRLYVKGLVRGVLTAPIAVPSKFNLARLKT
jgi:hypothetical protein